MELVVGRVVVSLPHPNADLIRLATIDTGDGSPRQIVYGGSRVLQPGDLVPVAPPGSRLPSGVKLRRCRYRGEISHGMLCSIQEMGWADEGPDEVHVLSAGLELGVPIADVKRPNDAQVSRLTGHNQTTTAPDSADDLEPAFS